MSRAIITDTEREQLSGDHGKQKRYEAASRIRDRIQKLDDDLDTLRTHHPDLYEELLTTIDPSVDETDPRDSRRNKIERAVEALEGTPPDPENPAVRNWAEKVGVAPKEIADALGG